MFSRTISQFIFGFLIGSTALPVQARDFFYDRYDLKPRATGFDVPRTPWRFETLARVDDRPRSTVASNDARPPAPLTARLDAGLHFPTLLPGASLPSGAECAARVRGGAWDPRPENARANRTPGTGVVRIDGTSTALNARFAPRIDGGFTGTTDEIIQWGACKWGLDEDVVRAVAVQESYWRQSTRGDLADGDYQSYGLLQIKRTVHAGTWPMSMQSTSFNVDYALAWRRACYEGDFTWVNRVQPGAGYRAGDEWGCVGLWFSGRWYDPGAFRYILQVQQHLSQRTWLSADF